MTTISGFRDRTPSLTLDKEGKERPILRKEGSRGYYELQTKKKLGDPVFGKGAYKSAKGAFYYNGCDLAPIEKVVLVVKRLQKNSDRSWEKTCRELDREIVIMEKLSGLPHVLQLEAVCKRTGATYRDQKYYLIVEKCESSLAGAFRSSNRFKLDVDRIAYEMATAIASLHERGFIHRDIKSANILLSFDGKAILTDFGSACETDNTEELKRYRSTYPSPEEAARDPYTQKLDDPTCTTQKSDSWTFGLLLYELYHKSPGEVMFEGGWSTVINEVKICKQNEIAQLVKENIPNPNHQKIILDLLQRDREKRISVAEARDRLKPVPSIADYAWEIFGEFFSRASNLSPPSAYLS